MTQFAQAKVSDKKVEQLALSKDSNYVLAMAEDKVRIVSSTDSHLWGGPENGLNIV